MSLINNPNLTAINFKELLGSESCVTATAIQTVGNKGYDGF
ncbi:MAG: hypothetical protein ACYTXY_38065 [Nostoc sp.]